MTTQIEFSATSVSRKSLKSLPEEREADVPEEQRTRAGANRGAGLHYLAEGDEEPDIAEPSAFAVACRQTLNSAKLYFHRHAAVKEFLRAVKEGNTTDALQCLANNPFLLTYRSFAKDGDSVWHLLAEYGDIMLLQALTNYCKIHDVKGLASKSRSRKAGHRHDKDNTISVLVNVGNKLRQTPLMFAAYHGRAEVVSFLLKQGANPWAADRCGKRTALHYACIRSHAACARALLEGLKDEDRKRGSIRYVDVPSASGFTPLHFAVACNCVPAALVLLSFDAHIDDFNIFDAGEFWISCATKSTPLHIAAISNRLHCAVAILQYWVHNRHRRGLDDPRSWCDKRGNTPLAIARQRGHAELASVLVPGADIPKHLTQADFDLHPVKKLQVVAAQVVKKRLLASIQEAEEFMKLLGTYQQHGRVFARLAYTSDNNPESREQASSHATGAESSDAQRGDMGSSPLGASQQWSRGPELGTAASVGQHSGLSTKISNGREELGMGMNKHQLEHSASIRGGEGGPAYGQQSVGLGKGSEMSGGGASSGNSAGGMPAAPAALKERKQAALKQWLSYERKAAAAGKRPQRRAPLQERSALSQINPDDEHHWMTSCLAFLRLRPTPVFLPPQAGEDVCGLCHDNKPGLAMESCGHRTCLLCAKSLCYLLDLQQLVLCPFCGSLVTSFGLG